MQCYLITYVQPTVVEVCYTSA